MAGTPRATKRKVPTGYPVKGEAPETPTNRRTRKTTSSKNRPRAADEGRKPGGRKRGKSGPASFRSGVRDEGKTTGRGRDVPGLPEAPTRSGGTPTSNRGKTRGATNRTKGRRAPERAAAVKETVSRAGRRPKSGMQG